MLKDLVISLHKKFQLKIMMLIVYPCTECQLGETLLQIDN